MTNHDDLIARLRTDDDLSARIEAAAALEALSQREARLRRALELVHMAWSNALEFNLFPPQYRAAAHELVGIARAALDDNPEKPNGR